MSEVFPQVVQSVAGENFTVYAYMTDGTVRLYDAKPLIKRGGLFEKIADEAFFREKLTVMNDTIAWDITGNMDAEGCIDIDPFTIADCPEVSDPLEQSISALNTERKS